MSVRACFHSFIVQSDGNSEVSEELETSSPFHEEDEDEEDEEGTVASAWEIYHSDHRSSLPGENLILSEYSIYFIMIKYIYIIYLELAT